MDFDTEKFIIEVQSRPVIWNTKVPEYYNKILKQRAWEELVHIYYGTELSKEKKNNLGLKVQKKWKNIRDCFVKAHRAKKIKSGAAAKNKSSYVFYDNLLFLKDTVSINTATGNVTTDSEDSNTTTQNEKTLPSNTSWVQTRSKKKYKDDHTSREFGERRKRTGTLNRNSERKNVEDDEDRLFFLSLVKEFKKIPEHMQMQTKLDILKVIKDAQTFTYQNMDFPGPHSYRGCETAHYSDSNPSQHRKNLSQAGRGTSPEIVGNPIKVESPISTPSEKSQESD